MVVSGRVRVKSKLPGEAEPCTGLARIIIPGSASIRKRPFGHRTSPHQTLLPCPPARPSSFVLTICFLYGACPPYLYTMHFLVQRPSHFPSQPCLRAKWRPNGDRMATNNLNFVRGEVAILCTCHTVVSPGLLGSLVWNYCCCCARLKLSAMHCSLVLMSSVGPTYNRKGHFRPKQLTLSFLPLPGFHHNCIEL